jgi:dihydroorotate dehydrogenase (NAD+) catalytic subunit
MVSLGTVIFHDPGACDRVLRELSEELQRSGIDRLADAVGLAHHPDQALRQRMSIRE